MQAQIAARPPRSRRSRVPATQSVGGLPLLPDNAPLDFEEVVRRHGHALLFRASRLTGRQFDAWDLVQDTLERAMSKPPLDLPPEKVRSWLFVIMHNLYLDRYRAALRRRSVALSDDIVMPDSDDAGRPFPAWRSFDIKDVHACLEKLEQPLRESYVLQAEQGLSLAAIAERLGTPIATVGTRVFRARRRLRQLLITAGGAE